MGPPRRGGNDVKGFFDADSIVTSDGLFVKEDSIAAL
jgi:hypothetical protein